ncbi:hypothetical protein CYMTET_38871 [Cymbomonas tetramitiformis]|uniref:Uncharacterized protein n=1 Tax=Cymbomonas tetramitiformis TaxID=36881 RepID=A0AAE0CCP5_9CHLO|nr:hypothetical protein CYMTET_38871 [Cymbomonas tetramitiformis]
MESEPSETCETIAKRACSTDGSHSGSASSHDPLLAYAAAAAHPSAGTHDDAWVRRERSRAQLHDETLRHMRSSEARAALLGRGLGGGARYLYSNSLTGTVPTELGELTRMITLYLFGNSLTGTVPTELGELTRMNGLQKRVRAEAGSAEQGGGGSGLMRAA